MRFHPAGLFLLLPLALAAHDDNTDYSDAALHAKTVFAEREARAVAEPFQGITANGEIPPGLFTLKPTGVTTAPLVAAAQAFIATLTPEQKLHTVFGADSPEWRRWCNVDNGIFVRQGVSLRAMSDPQRAAARALLQATLSAKGLALTDAIRRTDETLAELNHDRLAYGEDLYYFTVMGLPSPTQPWGWQIDGHHLVINTFVLGDQVVMSPAFLGGEPVRTTTGKYAGNVILQAEQDLALALMQQLTPAQRALATISAQKTRTNNQAEAFKDNAVIPYAGLPVTQFTPAQREHLVALIRLFIDNQAEGHARVRLDEILAHLDETRFAWIGGTSDDAVFYYRIHSPVVLIEFDHQVPVGTKMINAPGQVTRDHIHVVIRTPNGNDYGKDLLRQHLANHPH
ncbi:hypothetical protein Verru16b_00232 [Lacunisphaera limnophila]|uniref:DUF3500 domain-containing protein n=1 Tax=Lacunisphaera limnophila TaxID=1838286 RepID=A0A1I7PHU4_9BACT|nr:DUF3500 domain-containing protein [Lacunisphaera limnophila]AOS43189.1 hypothetical protein Verru16b_00232 [Lacunisphaera limnophila]